MMSITNCCKCKELIITTSHISDKSKALCGNCLFDGCFEIAWHDSDNECKGHSDYWNKMKLKVKEKFRILLLEGNE